jgi:hypothetical protein
MLAAVASDDVAAATDLLTPGQVYLQDAPTDAPRILMQKPPLPCVASYFGSLRCLKFFLSHGMDLFTPDKVYF